MLSIFTKCFLCSPIVTHYDSTFGIASEKLIFSSGPRNQTKPKQPQDKQQAGKASKTDPKKPTADPKVIKPIPAMLNKSEGSSPLQRMKKSIHDIVNDLTGAKTESQTEEPVVQPQGI